MSEPEFPARPAQDGSLPSAPLPAVAPPQEPDPTPSRRRTPVAIVAAFVALALVAGAGTFFLLRSGSSTPSGPATALTLAFDRGDQTTYDIQMKLDGSMDLGSAGSQPLSADISESVGWTVHKVAKDGTATVRVTVNGASGSANGQPLPAGTGETSTTLRVTPDGQIIGANGLSLGSMGGNAMTSFPGMDQVTPILPDHPVQPGDEWSKHFSQSFPFGDAKIEYTAHSTFERYEDVGGVRAAVITTEYTIPLDFSIDLGDLAKAFGGAGGGTKGVPSGKKATMTYKGSGTFTQTSFLDLKAKQMLKSSTDGSFDMTVSMPALSTQLGTDHISMSARFSLSMTRR